MPKRLVPQIRELRKLTYRDLDGSDCDDPLLRVNAKDADFMKDCADICQDGHPPEPRPQTRHESWVHLTGDFVVAGVGGAVAGG